MGASSRRVVAGIVVATALCGGCAKQWDVMTGKRFRKDPFGEPFRSVDPAAVITEPHTLDADQRAAAMRKLPDAKVADEAALLKTLETSAVQDDHGVCRMAAIEALSNVESPQAESALLQAYAVADKETGSVSDQKAGAVFASLNKNSGSTLAPEQVTQIQIRALEALGKLRSTQGLELILKAAKPPEKPAPKTDRDRFDLGQNEVPGLSETDLRLAALRALANYKGEMRAVALLIDTLKTDRDVAVRGRAHATLKAITGQNLPPDAAAWEQWRSTGAVTSEPSLLGKVENLFE